MRVQKFFESYLNPLLGLAVNYVEKNGSDGTKIELEALSNALVVTGVKLFVQSSF
jgi:hypothetical protein